MRLTKWKKAVKRFRNGVLYDLLKLLCVSGRGILPKWGAKSEGSVRNGKFAEEFQGLCFQKNKKNREKVSFVLNFSRPLHPNRKGRFGNLLLLF